MSPLISMVSAGSHSLEGNPPSFIEREANGETVGLLKMPWFMFATSLGESCISLITSILLNGLYLSPKSG